MDHSIHHKSLPVEELAVALASLPPEVRAVAALDRVKLVSWGHPDVPSDLAAEAVMDTFFGRTTSLCLLHKTTGQFLLILDDFTSLAHELIHVAQDLADEKIQTLCFDKICEKGCDILQTVASNGSVRSKSFSESNWCAKMLDGSKIARYRPAQRGEQIVGSFERYMDRSPSCVLETLNTTKSNAIYQSMKVSIFAYYLRESEYSCPNEETERECVAYGFEHQLEDIKELFIIALSNAEKKFVQNVS